MYRNILSYRANLLYLIVVFLNSKYKILSITYEGKKMAKYRNKDRARTYRPKIQGGYVKEYKDTSVTVRDILNFAFLDSGSKRKELVDKGDNVIKEMINSGGRLSLSEFTIAAGYDDSNAQERFWAKNNIYHSMYSVGILKEEYDDNMIPTHIALDNRFFALLLNYRDKWQNSVFRYYKPKGEK